MIINVTYEDIKNENPIKASVKREFNLDVIVDRKYLIFVKNQGRPFRLPVTAENFEFNRYTGKELQPFVFSIEATA